jgi:VacB/RNase II family 3'-5' exoribonuclease
VTSARVVAPAEAPPFHDAFQAVRREFDVPAQFPPECEAEAKQVSARGPNVPAGASADRRDERDIAFVTLDPPGTRDLDQALHIERTATGHRVRYAIADVAAFVAPGGAMDAESFRRGVTTYLPDGRAPMLPDTLTIGAASLLPNEDRPAIAWTFDLDRDGAVTATHVERSVVRSRAAHAYPAVQAALDAGTADEVFELLREVGERRLAAEAARGGVSLDLPTQVVVATANGGFDLAYEAPLPVEGWNAQLSLMTGMAAASIMVEAHVGIVRTVPEPVPQQLDRLRRTARALHVEWPAAESWGDVVRGLDRTRDADAAFLVQAAHVLRGAGYAVLDASNTASPDAVPVHAGVAAPYAHVTAPIRRLVDRYANEIVVAHAAGKPTPEWACRVLADLAQTMERTTAHAGQVDRAVIDTVECAVMAQRVGQEFEAVVVDRNQHGSVVQLDAPAVIAHIDETVDLGCDVRVRLVAVDPVARKLDLELS